GKGRVEELARAVREAGCIATGRPVEKRELDLVNGKALPGRVDRHPHLAAETRRSREARRARGRGECALAGKRLARLEAGERADQPSGRSLRNAEAPTLALCEDRDRKVGPGFEQR